MSEVYRSLDLEERHRIDKLEMFDEFEEFFLKTNHYFILVATKVAAETFKIRLSYKVFIAVKIDKCSKRSQGYILCKIPWPGGVPGKNEAVRSKMKKKEKGKRKKGKGKRRKGKGGT